MAGVGAENQPERASGGARGKAGGGGVLVTRQVLVMCTIDVLFLKPSGLPVGEDSGVTPARSLYLQVS